MVSTSLNRTYKGIASPSTQYLGINNLNIGNGLLSEHNYTRPDHLEGTQRSSVIFCHAMEHWTVKWTTESHHSYALQIIPHIRTSGSAIHGLQKRWHMIISRNSHIWRSRHGDCYIGCNRWDQDTMTVYSLPRLDRQEYIELLLTYILYKAINLV